MSTPLRTKRRLAKEFERLAGERSKYTKPHDDSRPHAIAWALAGVLLTDSLEASE